MITELSEFGNWLLENNQDGFGEDAIRDNDYIFEIIYNKGFNFGNITKMKDYTMNCNPKSIFNTNLYMDTSQNIIIPSNSNLVGFTPFLVKLDNDFLKNKELDYSKIEKFRKKVERTLKANHNDKDFIEALNRIFKYYNNSLFLENCVLTFEEKENYKYFFENVGLEDARKIILKYYTFLFENVDEIVSKIVDFKNNDEFVKKPKPNFYLRCVFNNDFDLINDIFYFYSKFIKSRNKSVIDDESVHCSICSEKSVTYPTIECFGFINDTSFNYNNIMKNSKLHLCKKCNAKVTFAIEKLKKTINNPEFIIIPKCRNDIEYDDFLKIANKKINSFDKINEFLKNNFENYDYDFLIYQKEQSVMSIKKYITNYRAFLVNFNNIWLYDNNSLKYLFNEKFIIKKDSKIKKSIDNIFDLENIFKKFFYDINDDGQYKYPNLFYFYQIFTKDIVGKGGIFYGFDSNIVSVFTTYMYNIFYFIYELNFDALNKDILNHILLTSIMKFQRKHLKFKNNNPKYAIIERLNYYYMIKKEFLGDNMLNNKSINELKGIFSNNDNTFEENYSNIDKILNEDPACKYYLIGQFIKHIDNFKVKNNKNAAVFNNFVTNANLNNIKDLFVTEVLQKNNFYIEQMNKKAKYLFVMLENNLDGLFNEEGFSFEDYILLIFTGYYTENILRKNYNNDGE